MIKVAMLRLCTLRQTGFQKNVFVQKCQDEGSAGPAAAVLIFWFW
jgi:hypothetical protein